MYLKLGLLFTCAATITIINNIKAVGCSKDETLLMRNLLRGYRRDVRPVSNASLPLPVEIQLKLKKIVELDARNQVLTTLLWLDYYWTDAHLVWNPVSTFYTKCFLTQS